MNGILTPSPCLFTASLTNLKSDSPLKGLEVFCDHVIEAVPPIPSTGFTPAESEYVAHPVSVTE